jgi:hypothetical protein
MRATRTPIRLVLAALGAAALLTATGTAAQADSATVKDKASDVVAYDLVLDEDATEVDQKESVLDYRRSIASGVDLRSMRVNHGKRTVSVTLKFAELRRDAVAIIAFRLDGRAEPERLFMNTSRRSGTVTDAKDRRKCKVPVTTRTGPKGFIRTTIDRSCLDDPTRIKATAVSVTVKSTENTLSMRSDALSPKNLQVLRWTKWLKAG